MQLWEYHKGGKSYLVYFKVLRVRGFIPRDVSSRRPSTYPPLPREVLDATLQPCTCQNLGYLNTKWWSSSSHSQLVSAWIINDMSRGTVCSLEWIFHKERDFTWAAKFAVIDLPRLYKPTCYITISDYKEVICSLNTISISMNRTLDLALLYILLVTASPSTDTEEHRYGTQCYTAPPFHPLTSSKRLFKNYNQRIMKF
jgi:hypothetical protein